MKIEEIIPLLIKGEKVRLKNWPKDIYIYIKDNTVKSSHGKDIKDYIDRLKIKSLSDFTSYIVLFFSNHVYKDWEVYKDPILDDVEKEYLSNIIKPFRDKVASIQKMTYYGYYEADFEYIAIFLKSNRIDNDIYLPAFKEGSMYRGMKKHKQYTLEELGL